MTMCQPSYPTKQKAMAGNAKVKSYKSQSCCSQRACIALHAPYYTMLSRPLFKAFSLFLLFLLCSTTSHTFKNNRQSGSSSRRERPDSAQQHVRDILRREADPAAENEFLWERRGSKIALRKMALEIVRREIEAAAPVKHNHLKRQLLSSPLAGTATTTSFPASATGTSIENGGNNGDTLSPSMQLHDKLDDLESFIADLAKLIADELPACNDNMSFTTSPSEPAASSSNAYSSPENTFTDTTIIRSPPVTSGALAAVQQPLSSTSQATLSSLSTTPIPSSVSLQNSSSSPSPAAATATGIPPYPPAFNNTNTTTNTSSTPDNSSSNSTFNPMSPSNLAVYYGQSPATSSVRLSTLCTNPSIDIIILAFVTSLSSPASSSGGGGTTTATTYPTINFGPYCASGPSAAQSAAGATGLLDCTQDLAPEIRACQDADKKVFVSLGGASGASGMVLGSEEEAERAADVVWGLFGGRGGGGGGDLDALRPFGDVVVDGFDDGELFPRPPLPPPSIASPSHHNN